MSCRNIMLGDLLHKGQISIQTGPFGTQLKASDYTKQGTPVINVRNIGYGSLRPDKLEYVPDSVCNRLDKHLLQKNDIVFGRKGAVDRHLLVRESEAGWMQGSDCIRLRFLSEEILPEFISYGLLLEKHKAWILTQCSNKSTMASLNQDVICRIFLNIPDTPIQHQIVQILSAYDDLIENNRRRIQLLEESARLLYREWFVHLRFPGHEHVKIVDGVPEGWEKKLISEVCETVGGGTPSTQKAEYWIDGDIPWVVPTDITRSKSLALLDTEKKITDSGLRNSSAKMVPPYTILMTSRASVGFFALTEKEVCTNQGFINVIPHVEESRMYILHNLMYRVDEIRSHAGGSTYKEINKTRFRALSIIIPTELLLKEFSDASYLIFKQVQALEQQNRKLHQARDLLLPRLMNGEITV